MTKTSDVLCIGHAIVDVLGHVDDGFLADLGLAKGVMAMAGEDDALRLHRALGSSVTASGGSAANTALGLASLGLSARFVGKVADDEAGTAFTEGMHGAGVRYRVPVGPRTPSTGRCVVLVTPDGERTMNTYLGAGRDLSPGDVDAEAVEGASVLFVEGYLFDVPGCRDACLKAIDLAVGAGAKVAVTLSDPRCVERNRKELLGLIWSGMVDLVFANRREAMSLYRTRREDDAIEALGREKGVLGIVTLSGDGAVVTLDGRGERVPAHPVERVVDTTGAGDMYAAGFLAGYCRGLPMGECAALAAFCAADVISRMGAAPGPDLGRRAREAGLLR